jgi:hypothetical protein
MKTIQPCHWTWRTTFKIQKQMKSTDSTNGDLDAIESNFNQLSRRGFILKTAHTVAGAAAATAGMGAMSAQAANAAPETEKATSPKESKNASPESLTNGMPYGTIRGLKISRLILGSNVPGAHSRDLIYVQSMGRAYCTREKMLETYELAESQGINLVLQGGGLVREYNQTRGGHLRTLRPVSVDPGDDRESIKRKLAEAAADDMAAASYIWGDRGDYLARAKKMDLVGTAMKLARELGIVLGVGGHDLEVPIQCEALGIKPDFYVKTFHNYNYWSATPKENRKPFCWYDDQGGNSYSGKKADHNQFHDNIWCLDPEKTIEVMRKVEVPWIAFKVLAAGAIHPLEGFPFAFRNGADCIAVGMLDFQIRANVDRVKKCAARLKDRARPWRA